MVRAKALKSRPPQMDEAPGTKPFSGLSVPKGMWGHGFVPADHLGSI